MRCPRCNQTQLVVTAIPSLPVSGVLCPECDAFWINGWLIGKFGHEGYEEFVERYQIPDAEFVDSPDAAIDPQLVEPDMSKCTLPTADQVAAPAECPRCQNPALVFSSVPTSVIAGVRCTACDAFWRAFEPIQVPGCLEFSWVLKVYSLTSELVRDEPVVPAL